MWPRGLRPRIAWPRLHPKIACAQRSMSPARVPGIAWPRGLRPSIAWPGGLSPSITWPRGLRQSTVGIVGRARRPRGTGEDEPERPGGAVTRAHQENKNRRRTRRRLSQGSTGVRLRESKAAARRGGAVAMGGEAQGCVSAKVGRARGCASA